MKEITRRLYTKPVMLGLSFLVAMVLAVGLFVTTKSRAAGTFIPEGDDEFETTGNGETYHNFQASPLQQGFFGTGSDAYTGVVPLVGVPLPNHGNIDTVIHRGGCFSTPCTVGVQMTSLSLAGINPITVTYNGGNNPESWTVAVSLSTATSSSGSMSINDGGTFDSTLKVYPKFTFTRVSDNTQRVLDTGASGSGLMAESSSGEASVQAISIGGDFAEPAPAPTVAISRCTATAIDSQSAGTFAATSSCAPVTLTSTNSPWQICNGKFCIPRPITEQELLASHNASPPGTKKVVQVQQQAAALQ